MNELFVNRAYFRKKNVSVLDFRKGRFKEGGFVFWVVKLALHLNKCEAP